MQAIRDRILSSRELPGHLLDRAERVSPPLNAVATTDVKRAQAAAAADEAAARTVASLRTRLES